MILDGKFGILEYIVPRGRLDDESWKGILIIEEPIRLFLEKGLKETEETRQFYAENSLPHRSLPLSITQDCRDDIETSIFETEKSIKALLEAQNRRLWNKSLYLSYFERDFDDILNNFWFFPR